MIGSEKFRYALLPKKSKNAVSKKEFIKPYQSNRNYLWCHLYKKSLASVGSRARVQERSFIPCYTNDRRLHGNHVQLSLTIFVLIVTF
jgi:hypothetical protein